MLKNINCINVNHPTVQEFAYLTGSTTDEIATNIGLWQNRTSSLDFPTIEEYNNFVLGTKNFDLQQAVSLYIDSLGRGAVISTNKDDRAVLINPELVQQVEEINEENTAEANRNSKVLQSGNYFYVPSNLFVSRQEFSYTVADPANALSFSNLSTDIVNQLNDKILSNANVINLLQQLNTRPQTIELIQSLPKVNIKFNIGLDNKYDMLTNEITINLFSLLSTPITNNTEEIGETIAHEILHFNTQHLLYAAANKNLSHLLSTEQHNAYKDLLDIVNTSKVVKAFKIDSVGELIANLSNVNFVQELTNENKSWWSKVLQFFGLKNNNYKLAEKALYTLLNTVNPLNVKTEVGKYLRQNQFASLDDVIKYKYSNTAFKDLRTTVFKDENLNAKEISEMIKTLLAASPKEIKNILKKFLTSSVDTILKQQREITELKANSESKEVKYTLDDKILSVPITFSGVAIENSFDSNIETSDTSVKANQTAEQASKAAMVKIEKTEGLLAAYTGVEAEDLTSVENATRNFLELFRNRTADWMTSEVDVTLPTGELLGYRESQKHINNILNNTVPRGIEYKYYILTHKGKNKLFDTRIFAQISTGEYVQIAKLYADSTYNIEKSKELENKEITSIISFNDFEDVKKTLGVKQISAGAPRRDPNNEQRNFNQLIGQLQESYPGIKLSSPYIYTDLRGQWNIKEDPYYEELFINGNLRPLKEISHLESYQKMEQLKADLLKIDKSFVKNNLPKVPSVKATYDATTNPLNGQPLIFYTFNKSVDFDTIQEDMLVPIWNGQLDNGIGIIHLDNKAMDTATTLHLAYNNPESGRDIVRYRQHNRLIGFFKSFIKSIYTVNERKDFEYFLSKDKDYDGNEIFDPYTSKAENFDRDLKEILQNENNSKYLSDFKELIKSIFGPELSNSKSVQHTIAADFSKKRLKLGVKDYSRPLAYLNISEESRSNMLKDFIVILEKAETLEGELNRVEIQNHFDFPRFAEVFFEFYAEKGEESKQFAFKLLDHALSYTKTFSQGFYNHHVIQKTNNKGALFAKMVINPETEEAIKNSLISTVVGIKSPILYISKDSLNRLIDEKIGNMPTNAEPLLNKTSGAKVTNIQPVQYITEKTLVNVDQNQYLKDSIVSILSEQGLSIQDIQYNIKVGQTFVDLELVYLYKTKTELEQELQNNPNPIKLFTLKNQLAKVENSLKQLNSVKKGKSTIGKKVAAINTFSRILNKKVEKSLTPFEAQAVSSVLLTQPYLSSDSTLEELLMSPEIREVFTEDRLNNLLANFDTTGLITLSKMLTSPPYSLNSQAVYLEINKPGILNINLYEFLNRVLGTSDFDIETIFGNLQDNEIFDTMFSTVGDVTNKLLGYNELFSRIDFNTFSSTLHNLYNGGKDLMSTLREQIDDDFIYADENGNPCAKFGAAINFEPGQNWEIVGEFKGRSHAQGGINIELSDKGVIFTNEGGEFKAENGLVINRNQLK